MKPCYEVEYCNLELCFDRRLIQCFIAELIEEGYSLYWNENDNQFIIAIRSGRKLIKLRFQRIVNRYKLVGTYSIRDAKLSELMEKLINDTRGHAVVKRFKDRQILIENIMFGEIIKTVEISGFEHKVLYEKGVSISIQEVLEAMKSNRIEKRLPILRAQLDRELLELHELLSAGGSTAEITACKERIEELRLEALMLEL